MRHPFRLPGTCPPRGSHFHASWCPLGDRGVLSHITENGKVWTRKALIFQYTIVGFCLEKAKWRQSRRSTTRGGRGAGGSGATAAAGGQRIRASGAQRGGGSVTHPREGKARQQAQLVRPPWKHRAGREE